MENNSSHKCSAKGSCDNCCTYIDAVSVSYNGVKAVDNINFRFSCGELTAIIGPNGGGKSSILKAILGEIEFEGNIGFCSTSGNGERPRIGYVPQNVSIQADSPINVIDLMLISQGYISAWIYPSKRKRREMQDLLDVVSAGNLAHRRIGELSGGELQRVLLACSLNPIPDLLLLDEPVSNVDIKGMESFYEIICNLRKKFHISILLVTHNIGAIVAHADNMILLNKKIYAMGTPIEVLKHQEFKKQMDGISSIPSKIIKDTHIHGREL
ncbi:MAG: metal ABC transporter ATP-binding protein [Leptospirales bacterium]|nr:metal ABC transporter ATP-binding protein [Leptospirales bacterium]